jgi:hypothetical protein
MDTEFDYGINRAQYDVRNHRAAFGASSKCNADIHLDLDPEGNPAYEYTIVRNGELVDHGYAYNSYEEAEGIVSRWLVQLNIASTSTEMWGQS